jgi:hypothetical protein
MRLINKFNGKNFHLWKFKMEMILMEFRICGRLLKEAPSSCVDAIMKKAYKNRVLKKMSIIVINLFDTTLSHLIL